MTSWKDPAEEPFADRACCGGAGPSLRAHTCALLASCNHHGLAPTSSSRLTARTVLSACSAQGSPCSISPCVYASIATRSMASPAGLDSVNGGGSASWTLSSSGGLLDGVPEAKGCDESVLGRDDGGRRTRFVHIPYIPFFFRKKPYKLKDFGKDLLAGVIAAVVAIPQGLAYAMLAGLPPVVGLYTAAMAPMVYSVLGTSTVCSIGPNALVAMFLPQIIARLKFGPDPVAATARASLAAIALGVIVTVIGMARLGGLVRFISSPVLAGFTNAAALVMAMSQLPNLLGFHMPALPYNYQQLSYLTSHVFLDTNRPSLFVGFGTILLLYACRTPRKFYPKNKPVKYIYTASTLVVVLVATVVARWLVLAGVDLPILGKVPEGLPSFALPRNGFNDASDIGDIISACVPVALVAFMSQWTVARKYAEMRQEELDPNQEAFALGVTNIVCGCFHSFPTAASFSRTALNHQSGARSALSNLFVGLVVLVALLAFTPYLFYLPMACLGGIIEVALFNLVEVEPFYKAYRVARPDFVVMVASFAFTLFVNIESGLVMGIILSIAVLLQELSEIKTSVLVPVHAHGRVHMRSRSVAGWDVDEHELVKVIKLIANVFFGNCDALKETFRAILDKGGDKVCAIVIDAAGVSHIDLSGIESLEDMKAVAELRSVKLVLLHAQGTFRDRLKSAGLWEALGEKYDHLSTDEAVGRILADGDWDPVLPGRLSPDKRPEASPLGLPVIVEQRTDEEAALLAPTTGTTVGGGTFARRASDRNVG